MNNVFKLAILCSGLLSLVTGGRGVADARDFLASRNHQSHSQRATPIHKIGSFTNMKHIGEHTYGYSVELWRQGDHLFGFFLSSDGLAGDTPTGLLENVRFNPSTGWLSFQARLTTGLFSNQQYNNVPSRDVFHFSGVLRRSRIKGNLEASNVLTPTEAPKQMRITLLKSKEMTALMIEAQNYEEWKEHAAGILKFRGPKW